MERIENIRNYLAAASVRDIVGTFDLRKFGSEIMWGGKPHRYFNSGLAREVYISPCRKYVLKVPIQDDFESRLADYLQDGKSYHLGVAASHNLFEAKCYHDAPKEYRRFLAKSELLPNFWVKQEFVDVREVVGLGLREIGVKKGRCVIFDYDVMLSDFQEPERGFNYPKLPKIIAQAEAMLGI